MMEIVFGNGYKAEFVNNEDKKCSMARLYSSDDVHLASVLCQEEDFRIAAEALMNGYFSGWAACRRQIKDAVIKAVNNVEVGL